jgi:hypothetical protein
MPMTLNGTTGIVLPTAAAPAFSAYSGTTTSISNGVYTKIAFNTEEYDTNSNYDTSLSRFTPTVAGYYQVNSCVGVGSQSGSGQSFATIYKNNANFKNGNVYFNSQLFGWSVNALIYFNGSTDYIEIYLYQAGGSTVTTTASQINTYFQATMVRSA